MFRLTEYFDLVVGGDDGVVIVPADLVEPVLSEVVA
jgi:regulator of RNase E activity RraA